MSTTAAVAKFQAEQDRVQGAFRDAIGRVVARIELYDEAESGASRALRLEELLNRCRELKAAFAAYERALAADRHQSPKPSSLKE